jgi:hypothetical protein
MIELLKKILDAVLIAVGFVLGKKQSLLDIENEVLKLDAKTKVNRGKSYEVINATYDEFLAEYNNAANANTVPKSDSDTVPKE